MAGSKILPFCTAHGAAAQVQLIGAERHAATAAVGAGPRRHEADPDDPGDQRKPSGNGHPWECASWLMKNENGSVVDVLSYEISSLE